MSEKVTNLRPRSDSENDSLMLCDATIPIVPGGVMQVYFYSCTACSEIVYNSMLYYDTALNPSPPEDWSYLTRWNKRDYYCPKHKVKQVTFVDGKEVEI